MKQPRLLMDDDEAVEHLVRHWAFRPHTTPIQIFNRATDPFLLGVKDHLFTTLESLDARDLSNHVLIITRWKVEPADVARLERPADLRITVLVTWSGIEDDRIEPVNSVHAERSLGVLHDNALRTKAILYWRPIIAGLNDGDDQMDRALRLSELADATVFTGLFHRTAIRDHFPVGRRTRPLSRNRAAEDIARRNRAPRDGRICRQATPSQDIVWRDLRPSCS